MPNTIKLHESEITVEKMTVENWKDRLLRVRAFQNLVRKFRSKASETQAKYYNAGRSEVSCEDGRIACCPLRQILLKQNMPRNFGARTAS